MIKRGLCKFETSLLIKSNVLPDNVKYGWIIEKNELKYDIHLKMSNMQQGNPGKIY